MITLRQYQNDLVQQTRSSFRAGKNKPLVVLPTGGGKTTCFSYIAAGAVAKGLRVWIIAHRKELIRQAGRTLGDFNLSYGIIKSGVPARPAESIQVASVQTLVGKLGRIAPPDLIVIDEAHHATSATYRKILDTYPAAKVIGVTATPQRLDGTGLGDIFDDIIIGPSLGWLTENGFLSPARYFAPPSKIDLTGVRTRRGDYETAGLEDAMNRPSITGDAVGHYQRLCDGKPMLVFCVSVKHAKDVADEYARAGYRAAHVDGTLDDETRDERINGLATGAYQVITSCDLIGEGLDVPVCVAAQLLRPTQSLVLHLQQIGRVLRVADGKPHAIILDHVGNLQKHNLADAPREWSLAGRATKRCRHDDEEDVKVRSCLQCFAAHEPAPVCPFCGFVYPPKPKSALEIKQGELEEIKRIQQEKKAEVTNARTYVELVALGIERGYKSPSFWAKQVMASRRGKRQLS